MSYSNLEGKWRELDGVIKCQFMIDLSKCHVLLHQITLNSLTYALALKQAHNLAQLLK